MKIKYQDLVFRTAAIRTIELANQIIDEYSAKGYSLTLRQLYYQFVSRDLCPNEQREYDRLSVVISNGRRAGLIDWDAIVDRTRFLRKPTSWDNPGQIIESCAAQFQVDMWESQETYVEVWFEKDALLGVFERAANPLRLPIFSCRGYPSDSEVWAAAQRFKAANKDQVLILHFGDHDPSGIDMTRDLMDRFTLFCSEPGNPGYGADFLEVRRMALNMDQVRKHRPPPNPAKQSDSRFDDYKAKFGDKSWELDALKPDVLVRIVEDAIAGVVDETQWDNDEVREEQHRKELQLVSDKWDKVQKFVTKQPGKK